MATIDSLLEQIKHNPASLLRHLPVQAVCQELKLKWRQRCLDPATTLGLFIGQIVHGNCSCAQVRHLAGGRVFSAQAYCKARKRLSLELIKRLSARVCESVRRQTDASALFAGHRVFLIDGSHVILPDTPVLQKEFGQPSCQKPGCGMPQAHLLALFDLSSGMLMDVVVSPLRTHDLAKASALHPSMRPGDLIVGDTGFSSYLYFVLLLLGGMQVLTPNHQRRIVDFTPNRPWVNPGQKHELAGQPLPRSRWIRSLGHDDQLVEWFKPPQGPAYMSNKRYKALPQSIQVRELRGRVKHPATGQWIELTLLTTLTDEKRYPAKELIALYLRRWEAEVNLRHLKTTMRMQTLKCQDVAGVHRELAMFVLVYNLLRLLMTEAAHRQKTTPDRISFADVLGWTRQARAGDPMPRFILNPIRKTRLEPRAIKNRRQRYDWMTRPRAQLRQALKKRGEGG